VRCHRRPFSHYVQWILRLARNLRVSCSATASLPNVEIHVGAEIASLAGDRVGGADPNAAWLTGCVETDEKGFIMTGKSVLTLETSQPGVFAIGDVRADSTKRVAAAVGEGAAVVAQIHALIAARSARREA
jgi:thioredoxin reductase (NADPH)